MVYVLVFCTVFFFSACGSGKESGTADGKTGDAAAAEDDGTVGGNDSADSSAAENNDAPEMNSAEDGYKIESLDAADLYVPEEWNVQFDDVVKKITVSDASGMKFELSFLPCERAAVSSFEQYFAQLDYRIPGINSAAEIETVVFGGIELKGYQIPYEGTQDQYHYFGFDTVSNCGIEWYTAERVEGNSVLQTIAENSVWKLENYAKQ